MFVIGVLFLLLHCAQLIVGNRFEHILYTNNGITLAGNSSYCYGLNHASPAVSIKCNNKKNETPPINLNPHVKSDHLDVFDLWRRYPLAIMENSSVISRSCKKAYNQYLEGLKRNELNALKMFDATAKLPSGILSGNVNQYGDFDECMSLEEGQYCLAEIDLTPAWAESHTTLKKLVHSHFALQETFDDPGHRVPGFTMVRWGVCIPRQCSHRDLENSMQEYLHLPARIRPTMCQKSIPLEKSLTFGDIFARCFFAVVLLSLSLSTCILHFWPEAEEYDNKIVQIFLAFALQQNWKQMKSIKRGNNDEIEAAHGIRALSALALIMSHKAVAILFNPFINRTAMTENLGEEWAVLGRVAIIYTDGFMFVSGLLNANALFSDLIKYDKIRFREKIINRIFRISPNIIAVILFCTYVLPNLGSGPMWPLVVNHHSELCRNYMWRNMLYIHNYYGFENMCLTHTHQVGIDMQLFILTPLIVYLLWKSHYVGFITLASLATASTILRFWVTWSQDISHFVHFGITVARMFNTANLSYILPTHRATVYLMGVYLAYLLKFTPKVPEVIKRNQHQMMILCLVAGFAPMLGPYHMAKVGYEYNKFDTVLFGTFSPILWGAANGWAIYAASRGIGGTVGKFLTWEKFRYFTKISYAVYLVQFPVFFYNVGQQRYAGKYQSQDVLQFSETTFIIVASITLTLVIELPFQKIKKIIFDKPKVRVKVCGVED